MNKYEVAVVLHPDLEIDMEAPLKRLDDMFKEHKAAVIKRDEWGKRKLAYAINRQNFGVYVFYIVEINPDAVSEIEHSLKLNEEVIRHLIIEHDLPHASEQDQEVDSESKE